MRELNEWEIQEKREAEKIVMELSRHVNNMSHRSEHFVKAVMGEHRTLQQSIFSLFLACVEEWSKTPENRYDLRNQYTVQTSRKIMECLEGRSSVPFI